MALYNSIIMTLKKFCIYKIAILLFYIFTPMVTFAQIGMAKEKYAIELNNRSLLVQLRSDNKDILKDLKKKPEEIKKYRQRYADANEALQKFVKKYWTINPVKDFLDEDEIEFVTSSKNDAKKYAILKVEYDWGGLHHTMNTVEYIGGYVFSVYLAERNNPILKVMVPTDRMWEVDYKFVFHNMQKYLTASSLGKELKDESLWNIEGNMMKMDSIICVVPRDAVDIDEDRAEKLYGHPIEFLSMEAFESLLENDTKRVLYPTIIFHNYTNLWMYALVDSRSMDIVSLVPYETSNGNPFHYRGYKKPKSAYSISDSYIAEQLTLGVGFFSFISDRRAVKTNYHPY